MVTNEDLQQLMELGHAAFLAFVYKRFGQEHLPRFLKPEPEKPKGRGLRETYLDASEELRELGLVELADIVEEYAKTRRSRWDEYFCPYNYPPHIKFKENVNNLKSWRARNEQDKKEYMEKRAERRSLSGRKSPQGD
jgi:hypothetical protein